MKLKEKEQLLEKIAELQKKVEKLEVESKSPFDVKNGEVAFFNYHGYISIHSDYWNKDLINGYIPCKDKNIVEQRQKRHHLNDLLEKFAYENNANVTDKMWKDEYLKYGIRCDYHDNSYYLETVITVSDLFSTYFTSKKIARMAINEVVIPFMDGNNE